MDKTFLKKALVTGVIAIVAFIVYRKLSDQFTFLPKLV